MLLDYKALSEPITDEMVQKYAPEETKWLGKTTIITAFVVLTGFIGTPLFLGDALGRGVDGGTIA